MVEGPVAGKKLKRRTVRNLIAAGVGILILFIIAVGGSWLYNVMAEKAAATAEHELEQKITELAAPFSTSIGTTWQALQKITSDPETVALFAAADKDELERVADDKLSSLPNGLRLRFLIPGNYDVESGGDYALGFASLDLLRNIEKGNPATGAEAHKFGSPDEHVVMVQGVKQDGKLVGLAHLSASADLFRQPLASITPEDGYVELRQNTSGKHVVLGKKGNAANRQGAPVVRSINNSRWEIAYWPAGVATAGAGAGGSMMIYLIVIGLLIVGVLAYVFYKKGKTGGAGKPGGKKGKDVVYQGAVRAIMDGAHPGVESLIPELPGSGGGKKPSAADVSPGLQVEDATMITNPGAIPTTAGAPDFDITGAAAPEPPSPPPEDLAEPAPATVGISEGIFRAYDIRGIVKDNFGPDVVNAIGKAIGSEALAGGHQGIVVGRDGRTHSPELADALIKGLQSTGQDVIDVGMVPTPVLYFATHHLEANSGVMLTGSHNGPEYNGLKIVIGGDTLSGDAVRNLYRRVVENDFLSGQGNVQTVEIVSDYIRRITEDIPVALGNAFKIVVDAGNGIAGAVAPQLYRAMGHDVIEMYCDVDGQFPNHHPDPSQPENLEELIARVKAEQADIGFAFDGDGDRLGVVDGEGNIIWPDRQLMLLARDVLSRNAGAPIIFDVKCSRYLKVMIESCGGTPLMWKTGHSLIKAKMKEVKAPLAGEMSGHIFFKERWYGFDDALYTGARMLEVLTKSQSKPAAVFATIPEGVSTPELRAKLGESEHAAVMSKLMETANFDDAEIFDIDGLRADFPDGWGLVRPSNTSPYLIMRFEAENQAALERIQGRFRECLLAVKSDLELPF